MPALLETLSKALGIIGKVQYYFHRRRAGLAPQGKGRKDAAFFFAPANPPRLDSGTTTRRAPVRQEEERCASQARSSGSTTPRGMGSSNGRAVATSSCTTRPFPATAS